MNKSIKVLTSEKRAELLNNLAIFKSSESSGSLLCEDVFDFVSELISQIKYEPYSLVKTCTGGLILDYRYSESCMLSLHFEITPLDEVLAITLTSNHLSAEHFSGCVSERNYEVVLKTISAFFKSVSC